MRRPQVHWGPAVRALAEGVLGKDTKGKGKGSGDKGKGKGQGGKGKGKGDNSKGKGKNKKPSASTAATTAVPPPGALQPLTGAPPATTAQTGVAGEVRKEGDKVVPASSDANSASSGIPQPQTYASLAVADEQSALDATMSVASGKREGEQEENPPVFKNSGSPVVERRGKAKRGNQ